MITSRDNEELGNEETFGSRLIKYKNPGVCFINNNYIRSKNKICFPGKSKKNPQLDYLSKILDNKLDN
jgi:hypothetical protein